MIDIKDDAVDQKNIDTTKNEVGDKSIYYDDNSNRDPISDESIGDF